MWTVVYDFVPRISLCPGSFMQCMRQSHNQQKPKGARKLLRVRPAPSWARPLPAPEHRLFAACLMSVEAG